MIRFLIVLAMLILLSVQEVKALSLSYLWGDNFREDLGYEREKLTMTIEHFQLWEYGNVFFYYDLTEPFSDTNGQSNQFFGGIAPTFSLSKMTGKKVGGGIVSDVSIRLELENGSGYGQNNFRNYFYGLQYDLVVPGFDFFSLNTVIRDNPETPAVGFQIGGFWQATREWGPWSRFKFTGFFATSPWNGDAEGYVVHNFGGEERGRYLTTQPQLLWDIGNGLFGKANRWELGVEYAYFLNRYQLEDKDEKVMQAMTKITF